MIKHYRARNTSLLILFILTVSICRSQPIQYGVFAGAQTTSATYHIADNKQSTSNKFGFHGGFTMKVPFETNLFFSPAAFYSLKGYKVKFNRISFPPDSLATDNNTTIHTFELAFLLQYDFGSRPNHFFLKAGPTLDFQLKGKEKFNRSAGSPVERDMTYGFVSYGRYAANFLSQFGFETGDGFMIFAQCSLGLTDLNNVDKGPRINHRSYGISIGKYFNGRKKIVLDTRNKE